MPGDDQAPAETYRLTLYAAGGGPITERVAEQIRQWCLARDIPLELDTVDVLEDTERTVRERVWATPTLIRNAPGPERRVVGEITATAKVMRLLQMPGAG